MSYAIDSPVKSYWTVKRSPSHRIGSPNIWATTVAAIKNG